MELGELAKHFLRALLGPERRKHERRALPGLVAFYWDGGTPVAHGVQQISPIGMYLLTDQRWYPGTVIAMTLQWIDASDSDPDRSIAVRARAVRHGTDGVGLMFLSAVDLNSMRGSDRGPDPADTKAVDRFVKRWFKTIEVSAD